jgi:hypothetical protein
VLKTHVHSGVEAELPSFALEVTLMFSKSARSAVAALALAFVLMALPRVYAQTDINTVKKIEGTILKADANSLTVRTDKGDVTLSLDEKTQITVSEKPATIADLKQGQQVSIVVDGTKVIAVEVAVQTAWILR